MNFIQTHPYIFTAVTTFFVNYVWSAMIGALEAPTAQSSSSYKFWFKFLNGLAANIARAKNTSVESSPNWVPAVKQVIASPAAQEIIAATPKVP